MSEKYYKISLVEIQENESTEEEINTELSCFLFLDKQKWLLALEDLCKFQRGFSKFFLEFKLQDGSIWDTLYIPENVAISLLTFSIKVSGSLENLRAEAKQNSNQVLRNLIKPDITYP